MRRRDAAVLHERHVHWRADLHGRQLLHRQWVERRRGGGELLLGDLERGRVRLRPGRSERSGKLGELLHDDVEQREMLRRDGHERHGLSDQLLHGLFGDGRRGHLLVHPTRNGRRR
jgi:hypothetical protein